MKKYTLIALLITGTAFTAFKNSDKKNTSKTKPEVKNENLIGSVIIYEVDAAKSTFNWTGKKVTGEHTGNINIANGKIFWNKGSLIGGEFEVDMNSLADNDLTDAGYKAKLEGHLKSEDFFDVAKFPKSIFKVKLWTPIKDAKSGTANYNVKGDLTIKGITKEITFPTIVNIDAKTIKTSADFNIDRTAYDLKYRSGKFDPGIGDKLIYDEFNVKINLIANAK